MSFSIKWTPAAEKQLKSWYTKNPKKIARIKLLCQSIEFTPTTGIGKPERLKGFKENVWSRRIDTEHRIVYHLKSNKEIYIVQCMYHY